MITQQQFLDRPTEGRQRFKERSVILYSYPWIKNIFDPSALPSHTYRSSISLDILYMQPLRDKKIDLKEDIYFLSKTGGLLWYPEKLFFSSLLFWMDQPVTRQVLRLPDYMNVAAMLTKLGSDAEQVKYIISYSEKTDVLIIYESPEEYMSVVTWLDALRGFNGLALSEAERTFTEAVRKYI